MRKDGIKNKFYKSIRKVMATAVAGCMLVASPYTFAADADDYKAWLLDFESGTTGVPDGMTDSAGRVVSTDDSEHGTVLKIESRDGSTASLANVFAKSNKTGLDAKDYIFSFDFCAKQTNVGYIMQSQSIKSDGATVNYVCFVIDNDGTVGFAKNGGWVTPDHGEGSFHTKVPYSVDAWHTADVVVDVDGKKISYYIDGVHLGDDTNSGNFGTGVYRSSGILTGSGYVIGAVDTANQAVYFDNFRVTYTGEDSFYEETDVVEGAVSVNFFETPANDLSAIQVYDCSTGKKVNVSDVKHSGKKLSFSLSNSGDSQHAIALPEDFKSVAGTEMERNYIYFYPVKQSTPYISLATLTDVYGVEYGPLDEIPITQSVITIKTEGAVSADADSILKAVSLADKNGAVCKLSNPQISDGKISIDIDGFLNMSGEYTLSVNNLSGMNYKAVFKTNSDTVEGFFPVGIVLKEGVSVVSIDMARGAEVYGSTEFINTTPDSATALVTVAAYKNTDGIYEMIAVDTAEITIPSMSLVVAGPGKDEEKVAITVPAEADVVKTFLWKSASDKHMLADMMALPEISATVPQGEEGIQQSENGSMILIAKDKKADSEYTVAVTAKGKEYGDDAVYADQLISDAEGTAAIAFNMSSVSGDYTAIITDSDGVAEEFDFAYVNPAEFAQTAEKLDRATSAKEYEDILKVDYQSLGISEKLFESVDLTQTAELLYNKVQDEKITLAETLWSDGVELAKKSFIIGAVANGSVDNLFVYSDELNLKEDKNWEWYTKEYVKENVQKAITTRQTGNYTTEDEFYEKLTESYVLSVVKSPDGVGNLKEVVQNFADEIGIKETGKDSTYRALVGIDFDTYKDIKDKFNELEKAGTTSKPSGGGGGGGGSRGGSLSKEYATEMKPETVTEPIEKDIFEDIEDFGWAKQSIVYLAEKRIVTGKTKTEFCPDDSVTREEFAAMLVRAFAENAETAKVSFTDTEDGAWYIEYLGKAVQTGIIKGYDDGRFGIGETITRQDMAVMLNRAAEYAGVVLEAETGGETFSDDKEIADYAKEAVYALKKAGIINGVTADSYAPLQSANRAQAAKVIFGLLNI